MLFILVLAFPLYKAVESGRRADALTAQDRALLTSGKQLYGLNCASCHGTGGLGVDSPALNSQQFLTGITDEQMAGIIRGGIPGTEMPSFRSPLTERAIRQAATYVQSLSRSARRAAVGNAQHGKSVYEANGCASCHTVAGGGGILGPELTNIGAQRGAPYLREALVKPEAAHPPGFIVVRAVMNGGGEVRGNRAAEDVFWVSIRDARGVHTLQKSEMTSLERQLDASLMPSYATRLTAGDLDDLVVYLTTLRSAK